MAGLGVLLAGGGWLLLGGELGGGMRSGRAQEPELLIGPAPCPAPCPLSQPLLPQSYPTASPNHLHPYQSNRLLAGQLPRQYYYDLLARTAFWAALFAFVVMAAHLACLGVMMWRHARVPDVMWFPRLELIVCLAILPALAFGAAGLFNCSAGDIALGAVLLVLLPCSFLGAAFFLVWRWLQHPALMRRRAIFVLHRDPLAAAIAAHTPGATPTAQSAAAAIAAAGEAAESENGAANGAAHAEAALASTDPSAAAAMQLAQARRWTFVGFARSLAGSRKLLGDWCGINLDSRFVFKYGPLFEATYGQAMARRRATYEFDPARGKVDRGALVVLPELAMISWR